MLPGRKITPEDAVAIAARRFWLVIIPMLVIGAGAAVVSRRIPDSYRSMVTIQVTPQQVPENYVRSTVTQSVNDQLNAITSTILSRTNLERIITDLDLYAVERRTGIMEDIVDRMKNNIHLVTNQSGVFSIGFDGENPKTVKAVADKLATLFIDQNLRERQQQAEGTDEFLDSQLEDARRQLSENEHKVASYRTEHAGELPTQLQANLAGIQSTELQIQATVASVNSDRQRLLVLEGTRKDLQDQASDPAQPAAPGTPGTAAQQLVAAKNTLAVYQVQLRYTDDHPAVKQQKALIADLQEKADAEALARPVSEEAPVTPVERARRQRLKEVESQIDLLNSSITAKLADEERLRQVTAVYQKRAEAAPTRETEMIQLTRDYGTTQQLYTSLLAKKQESKIASNLERRQIGEQFAILDAARLPERPFSPNRRMITGVACVVGAVIGLGLIVLLEYMDKTFKVDTEVTELLELPVLAAVPFMRSAPERRRRLQGRLVANLGLAGVALACVAVVAYTFVR